VLGAAGLVVANAVVIWAAPGHRSPYLPFLLGSSGNPQGLAGAEVHGGSRWAPALLFVLTAGVLALRSPITALAVPTLAWRAASSNVSYWQTYFHYDAVLVPIAAVALVDVLSRPVPRPRERWVRAALVAGALGWSAWVGLAKIAAWQPWDPQRWTAVERMRDAAALGELVPRGAAVVAQQDLGPAVLARVDVRMLTDSVPAQGRWVLLTADGDQLGAPEAARRRWLAAVGQRPGVEITRRGSCLLVRLAAPEAVRL